MKKIIFGFLILACHSNNIFSMDSYTPKDLITNALKGYGSWDENQKNERQKIVNAIIVSSGLEVKGQLKNNYKTVFSKDYEAPKKEEGGKDVWGAFKDESASDKLAALFGVDMGNLKGKDISSIAYGQKALKDQADNLAGNEDAIINAVKNALGK